MRVCVCVCVCVMHVKMPYIFFLALQDHTLVGRSDASPQQDIQLSGIGIKPQHAIVDIEDSEVYITPLEDAR